MGVSEGRIATRSDNGMEVTIKLYGVLRRHRPAGIDGAPHHPFTVELPERATVDDLRALISLGDGHITAVAVNGESAEMTTVLHDSDVVSFFPPAAGG